MSNNIFEVTESTFVYFPKPFDDFSFDKFKVNVIEQKGFDILLAYSYDNRNFSAFKNKHNLSTQNVPIYVCVWLQKQIQHDLERPIAMFEINDKHKFWANQTKQQNVDSTWEHCVIDSFQYDGTKLTQFVLKPKFDTIDEFPRWNFYDVQQINIQRWLETCNATAEMYGHSAIYFKTEPIRKEDIDENSGIHGTHFTLANNVIRNVVDVKRIHIMFPNNELPQDRVVFSEWDIAMQDETVIHVVRQKFEQAFGLKAIPNEKDYIYLPIINKLFRVSTMQVKNGFMGVVGWYEVYLAKYEEDETVRKESILINENLDNTLGDVFGFDSKLFGFEPFQYENPTKQIDEQLDEIKSESIERFDDMTERIEEEKAVTSNLRNNLRDTTFHVSLKETEAIRDFYDRRLQIVSINPGDSVFPIMMYNCSSIEKNQIALNYDLSSYTLVNKFSLTVRKQFSLCFDFVLMGRHSGEIISMNHNKTHNLNSIVSLSLNRNKLVVFDVSTQMRIIVEYDFKQKELYQICVEYVTTMVYHVKIYKLSSSRHDKTTQKQLLFQEIYNLKELKQLPVRPYEKTINGLNLFGGNMLIANVNLKIDDNHILEDKCLPLIDKKII